MVLPSAFLVLSLTAPRAKSAPTSLRVCLSRRICSCLYGCTGARGSSACYSEVLIRRFKGNEVTFESFPERTLRLVTDPWILTRGYTLAGGRGYAHACVPAMNDGSGDIADAYWQGLFICCNRHTPACESSRMCSRRTRPAESSTPRRWRLSTG